MHVPGWHAATREAQEDGRLTMLGIVLEQHPERARLFMQWQRMPWRLLHDPFNLLALPYVPLTLAIDEWGIIRAAQPQLARADELIEHFVDAELAPPAEAPQFATAPPDLPALQRAASANGDAAAWADLGAQLALWRGEAALDEALAAGERALGLPAVREAQTHFQQGVVYRMRHDSARAEPGDFRRAVSHWSAALRREPNNYIWRRRIQQYGPRLAKPYSFYDWLPGARADVRERGKSHCRSLWNRAALNSPIRPTNSPAAMAAACPMMKRRASCAMGSWCACSWSPCRRVWRRAKRRACISYSSRRMRRIGITNPSRCVIALDEGPPGWQWERRRLRGDLPAAPTSAEARHLELELRAPSDAPPGKVTLSGYALYYVCADASGVCLYLRQDFGYELEVLTAESGRLKDPGPPRPGTKSASPHPSP